MRVILLVVLLLVTTFSASSQTIYVDSGEKEDSSLVMELYRQVRIVADSLHRLGLPVPRLEIMDLGFEKYLLVDGRFDMYYWTGSRWQNLYQNKYHGYNFMSRKFACDLTGVFSYGGYGYWMHHGHIIQFDFGLGKDWNLMKYSQQFPLAAMYSDSCKVTILGDSIYKIDVPSQRILSITPNPLKEFFKIEYLPGNFESLDYLVLPFKRVIVKKKSDEIAQVPQEKLALVEKTIAKGNGMFYIRKNKLYFLTPDNGFVDSLDIEELFKSGKPVTTAKKVDISLRPVIVVLGISIPLFLAGFWFSRQRRDVALSTGSSIETIDRISYKRLLPYAGETLSVEQLDDILELSHTYPAESQRFKRFQAIRDINDEYTKIKGKPLIVRQRDPEDGRRFVYCIQRDI